MVNFVIDKIIKLLFQVFLSLIFQFICILVIFFLPFNQLIKKRKKQINQ